MCKQQLLFQPHIIRQVRDGILLIQMPGRAESGPVVLHFASYLLTQEDADVLGHRYLSTTFIYTKLDFNALEQVALEWPEEVGS